jgi:hypothetical protein
MLLVYFVLTTVMVHSVVLITTVLLIPALMEIVLHVVLYQCLNVLEQFVHEIVIVLLILASTTFAPSAIIQLDLIVMGQHAQLILIVY